jgi:hypothetical protein
MLVLAIVVSTVLVGVSIKADLPVSQLTVEYKAAIKSKQDFVASRKSNVALTRTQQLDRELRYEEIVQDSSLTAQESERQLNEIGYYTYDDGSDNTVPTTRSSSQDVHLDKVSITYNANNDTWILKSQGAWTTNGYTKDVSENFNGGWINEGDEHDIGGSDTLGIAISVYYADPDGKYLTLLSGYGKLFGGKENSSTSSNRSAALPNSENGALYEVRDYMRITKVGFLALTYQYEYIGLNFQTQLVYNGNFANIAGKATMFYAHTWDKTKLTGVTAGVGVGAASIGITWNTTGKHWAAISGSDTPF